MKKIFLIIPVLAFVGCKQEKTINTPETEKDSINTPAPAVTEKTYTHTWRDTVIADYIQNSDKELIKLALKDTTVTEEWLFDQHIKTDTKSYYVYQIGHDVSDPNGDDLRFVTDQWIHLDSITHDLYEYDPAEDEATKWIKK